MTNRGGVALAVAERATISGQMKKGRSLGWRRSSRWMLNLTACVGRAQQMDNFEGKVCVFASVCVVLVNVRNFSASGARSAVTSLRRFGFMLEQSECCVLSSSRNSFPIPYMSFDSATKPAERVFHFTFYKCGSQWIRDLLTDRAIVAFSQCPLSVSGHEVSSAGWPEVPEKSVASPLYTAGEANWRERRAGPADRAVVILRDPRDMVVSLVFSMNYSHTPDGVNRLLRPAVRNAQPVDRIMLGMHMLSHWSAHIRSWLGPGVPNAYVTRYESLLADEAGEFAKIINFLGWPVPAETVAAVAAKHSFQARSGRKRGVENEFSHRRKGVAGDWRNHFTQGLGRLFEETFPGMLVGMGYESGPDWWRELPEVLVENVHDIVDEKSRLLKVLEQHESELVLVREAAEKRLEQINILTKANDELLKQRNFFEKAASDRMAVIDDLKNRLASALSTGSGQSRKG